MGLRHRRGKGCAAWRGWLNGIRNRPNSKRAPGSLSRFDYRRRGVNESLSPRPSGLRPGARGGRSSACAAGVGATPERAERAAFNPRACAHLRGRIPASGAAIEVEQGPQRKLGMRPEIRRRRNRPPPATAFEVRSPNQKRSGPLFHSAAAPASRCGAPARRCPPRP